MTTPLTLQYFSCASPVGLIQFALAGTSVCALWFDEPSKAAAAALAAAAAAPSPAGQDNSDEAAVRAAARVRAWLDAYFAGDIPGDTPPLQLCVSPFTRKISSLLLKIPYGSTTTYFALAGQIAAASSRPMAAQAVGGAAGRNPVALLVPCHRLCAAHGRPGGYAYGVERKLWLLEHERRTLKRLHYPRARAQT